MGVTKARKPSKLKLVQGTLAKSPIRNKREPPGTFAVPEPPDYLSPLELAAWERFADCATRMRITTSDDWAAFESLALTYAEAQRLRAELRSNPLTYVTTNSQGGKMIRARPELALLGDIDRRLLSLLARFGMTPADRSRVDDLGGSRGPGVDPDAEFTP